MCIEIYLLVFYWTFDASDLYIASDESDFVLITSCLAQVHINRIPEPEYAIPTTD